VASIVAQSTREGVLSDASGTLTAAFEFTTKAVRDVEVPIGEMVLLAPEATPRDIQQAVASHGFSRYILTDRAGEPAGYLHLKDVMDLAGEAFDAPVPAKRVRRLTSVSRDAELEDALAGMRRSGSHVARALTPDGSVTGVLFLEDIIEELVGEVTDATSV
jgi:CBS domain containing-hemolysin-like protein